MILNPNILTILKRYSNPQNYFYEKLYFKKDVSNSTIGEFQNKIFNNKKVTKEHFNFWEADISLDKDIDSINSQKNNKFPGNDGLTAEFFKPFPK